MSFSATPRRGSRGPLEPDPAIAVARVGDVFQLGPHRIVLRRRDRSRSPAHCWKATPPRRLVLTDEPYNVKIAGNVTGGRHREFAMASGEMTDAEFLAFNEAWMAIVLPYLCDGGVCGTFIDWRGLPTVIRPPPQSLGLKSAQSYRLGKDQRRHGQSLPLAA